MAPPPSASHRSASARKGSTGAATSVAAPCSLESPTCRLCWAEEDPADPLGQLVSPCSCSGSIAHIHLRCLLNWQEVLHSQGLHGNADRCELCQQPYRLPRGHRLKQACVPTPPPQPHPRTRTAAAAAAATNLLQSLQTTLGCSPSTSMKEHAMSALLCYTAARQAGGEALASARRGYAWGHSHSLTHPALALASGLHSLHRGFGVDAQLARQVVMQACLTPVVSGHLSQGARRVLLDACVLHIQVSLARLAVLAPCVSPLVAGAMVGAACGAGRLWLELRLLRAQGAAAARAGAWVGRRVPARAMRVAGRCCAVAAVAQRVPGLLRLLRGVGRLAGRCRAGR